MGNEQGTEYASQKSGHRITGSELSEASNASQVPSGLDSDPNDVVLEVRENDEVKSKMDAENVGRANPALSDSDSEQDGLEEDPDDDSEEEASVTPLESDEEDSVASQSDAVSVMTVTTVKTVVVQDDARRRERESEKRRQIANMMKQQKALRDKVQETTERTEFPPELEQSDAFKLLGTQPPVVHYDYLFITTSVTRLDRYVRQTMFILLKWLSTLKTDKRLPDGSPDRTITMHDLSLYCRYFPAEFNLQYQLRVERVLNSNGLSLHMDNSRRFDPEFLSSYFTPTFTPTVKRCKHQGRCDQFTNPDPTHPRYCACFQDGQRKCGDHCMCDADCPQRKAFADRTTGLVGVGLDAVKPIQPGTQDDLEENRVPLDAEAAIKLAAAQKEAREEEARKRASELDATALLNQSSSDDEKDSKGPVILGDSDSDDDAGERGAASVSEDSGADSKDAEVVEANDVAPAEVGREDDDDDDDEEDDEDDDDDDDEEDDESEDEDANESEEPDVENV